MRQQALPSFIGAEALLLGWLTVLAVGLVATGSAEGRTISAPPSMATPVATDPVQAAGIASQGRSFSNGIINYAATTIRRSTTQRDGDEDQFPSGVRYVPGSAKLNGHPIGDPELIGSPGDPRNGTIVWEFRFGTLQNGVQRLTFLGRADPPGNAGEPAGER